MDTLQLQPLRWTLLWPEDAEQVNRAGNCLDGGYRHAASIQSLFYLPGTISQRLAIAEQFNRTDEPFPTASFARQALERSGADSHYGFDESDGIWTIRSRSPADFSARPGGGPMRVYLEGPAGVQSFRLDSTQVRPFLALIETLGGATSLDAICALAEAHSLQGLLGMLASDAMVTMGRASAAPDVASLPEFLYFGHSSFAVRDGATLVAFDPVCLPGNDRAPDGRSMIAILRAAAFIVISHHHWDHLHLQTLCRLPRDTRFVVPRTGVASWSNPPMAAYLRSLGFHRILECTAGDVLDLDGVILRCFPFRGEPFGLDSRFDGVTLHVAFGTHTLFASVDAWANEDGDMEAVIEQVARLGSPELFLAGASGQFHPRPCAAAGLRHFSNELQARPDLIRYHPTMEDAQRWCAVLKPRVMIPYADFSFSKRGARDLDFHALTGPGPGCRTPVRLAPLQGIRWGGHGLERVKKPP